MSGSVGYKQMTEAERINLAWAAFMTHSYDKAWGAIVTKCGKITPQEAVDKELLYVEYKKWDKILCDLKYAQY